MIHHKKGKLCLLISLTLQLGTSACYAGDITGNTVSVDTSRQVPIVQIQAPTNGLSHNTYDSFSMDNGVILNNATTSVSTHLAGEISANSNLTQPANIIVNEVTGTSASQLTGTLEVAGQKADVIIANPNGITINNLHFINTDRAVLTTGQPHIVNDKLESISVTRGDISVNGNLNEPLADSGNNSYDSIDNVDLFAKAVHINAEIFAKDKLSVITGANQIDYQSRSVTKLHTDESTKVGISLDVAALGGMYAHTISLVGTDKGLGVNLEGTVDALTGNLQIDTAGNLTITQHTNESGENTTIHAGKDIHITSGDVINKGTLISDGQVNIKSDQFANDGNINAKDIQIQSQNMEGKGILSSRQDITVKTRENIRYEGGISADDGTISLTASQVDVLRDNIHVSSKDKLIITESNPRPQVEEKKSILRSKKEKTITENEKITAVENLPNKTVITQDIKDLALTVDTNASKNYQPIIDKTRNGIDLVTIVQVDGQGVSHNKYIDFNVKEKGLILNNATKYVNTKLAGYVDKNMFLAGRGAKTIINEIASTHTSNLNGYIEVAGNPADVIIINPNGMVINGLGFINSQHVELRSFNDINVLGKGLNGIQVDGLDNKLEQITIKAKLFSNLASELWGSTVSIDAADIITNTGKIGVNDLVLNAKTLYNTGFVEGKNNILVDVENLAQEQGTIKAGEGLHIHASTLKNVKHSLLEAHKNVEIYSDTLDNDGSNIVSNGKLSLQIDTISNNGVIATKDALQVQGTALMNTAGHIIAQGSADLQLSHTLENTSNGLISVDGDSHVTVKKIINDNSKLLLDGANAITSEEFHNQNRAYVGFGRHTQLQGSDFVNTSSVLTSNGNLTLTITNNFLNEDSLLQVGNNLDIFANTIRNTNKTGEYYGAEISVGGNLDLTATESFENRSSDMTVKGNIRMQAPSIANHKESFATDWVITEEDKYEKIPHLNQANYYDADRRYHRIIHTGQITKETDDARIISSGSIQIIGKSLVNWYSQIMAGKDLDIKANNLENVGYQGTIHYDDLGRDRHYWKYKKKRRWWKRSKWVHGHTDFPYEHHEVLDQPLDTHSERIAVLGSNGTTVINADSFVNQTLEANGKTYELRAKKVDTAFKKASVPSIQSLDNEVLSTLFNNTQKVYLAEEPLATFTKENDSVYTDKKEFLSSEYMLSRLTSDPETVYRRLSNGYEEQEFVRKQLLQLRNHSKLGLASDEDVFKRLMDNGVAVAKTLDLRPGISLTPEQTVRLTSDIVWLEKVMTAKGDMLVPKVYLGKLNSENLQSDGSIVFGRDVTIKGQRLANTGVIQGINTLYVHGQTLENLGGSITAKDVSITDGSILNISGNIHAGSMLKAKADTLLNTTKQTSTETGNYRQDFSHNQASITSDGSSTIDVGTFSNKAGAVAAKKHLDITAGEIVLSALSTQYKADTSNAKLDFINHIGSSLQGSDVKLKSDIITSSGSSITGDRITIASNTLQLDGVKDSAFSDVSVGSRGSNYFNRKLIDNETSVGSQIKANDSIQLQIAEDLQIKASSIVSNTGKTDIQAKNISIVNDKEHHELLEEFYEKSYGFLSSKTTDVYNYQTVDSVVGSTISSGAISLHSDKDLLIKASHVVADSDVAIGAKENVTIQSAVEKEGSTYVKSVKKSGIFSGGGLGITIGKQQQKDSYDSVITSQQGSIVGSKAGNVAITSQGATTVKASDLLAKKDITVNGTKIDVIHGLNTSVNKEKHEFKRSGLTLSLSNDLLSTATGLTSTIKQATAAKDERLQALLAYKAYDDAHKSLKKANIKSQAKSLSLNVSLGTQSSTSNVEVTSKQAKPSNLIADGNIALTTSKDDISIIGSKITANTAELNSAKDIKLQGSENSTKVATDIKFKSASMGISYDLLKGSISDINVSASGSKGRSNGEDIVHQPAVIEAEKLVNISSKKDFTITDGKVEGNKVVATIGGSLNVKSLQDIHNYSEDNTSGGLGVSLYGDRKFKSSNGSINTTDIDSDYTSVVHQAGIYAGQDGFDVTVSVTTKLTGAVLASKTDNNSLTTKNLVMKDIANRAKYSYTSIGLSYLNDKKYKDSLDTMYNKEHEIMEKDEDISDKLDELRNLPIKDKGYAESLKHVNSLHNEVGLLPNVLPGETRENYSLTKSAIANGNIAIENPEININMINHDIHSSLHKLEPIFDKQNLQERQELAKLFNKYSNEAIHHMADKYGWKEGSTPKIALHALVGKVTSNMIHGNANVGMTVGGMSEALSSEIMKLAKEDPGKAQRISYLLGYATAKMLDDNGQQGGSISQYAIKWNGLVHYQQNDHYNSIYRYLVDNNNRRHKAGIVKVLMSGIDISNQNKDIPDNAENKMIYELERAGKILGVIYKYNEENGLTGEMLRLLSLYNDKLPNRNVLSFNGGIGVGVSVKASVAVIKGEIGASSHLDYDTRRKNLAVLSKAGANVGIGKNMSIGVEASNITNPQDIHDNKSSVNINVGKSFNAIGQSSLYNDDTDIEASIGGGIYVGGGGEANLNLNFSALKDYLWNIKDEKEILSEEINELLEEYNK